MMFSVFHKTRWWSRRADFGSPKVLGAEYVALLGLVSHCFSTLLECINEIKRCNEQMTHMAR